jgi:hypothetical protein
MRIFRKYKYYFLVPAILFVLFTLMMFFFAGSDEGDPFVYQFF